MTISVMPSQSVEWGDESHMVTGLKQDCGRARFGSVGLLDEGCWGRDAPWLLLSTWFDVSEEFRRVFLSVPF